ncbi:MAG TPA: hypothetical protein VE196_11110, partial [Pseudonocardiaceae bacterium]|nr:hypothetical protein [Pseudonocardiaceae bacterium]
LAGTARAGRVTAVATAPMASSMLALYAGSALGAFLVHGMQLPALRGGQTGAATTAGSRVRRLGTGWAGK